MKKMKLAALAFFALVAGSLVLGSCSSSSSSNPTPAGACGSAPMLGSWKMTGGFVNAGGTTTTFTPTVVALLSTPTGTVTFNADCSGTSVSATGTDKFTYSVNGNQLSQVEAGKTITLTFTVSGNTYTTNLTAADLAAGVGQTLDTLAFAFAMPNLKGTDIVSLVFTKQ